MTSISAPWDKFASQFPCAEEYDQKRRRTYMESEMYKLISKMYPKLFSQFPCAVEYDQLRRKYGK